VSVLFFFVYQLRKRELFLSFIRKKILLKNKKKLFLFNKKKNGT